MAPARPRVVFALEPRAYREAYAAAVGAVRPGVDAVAAAPDELAAVTADGPPALIVRSTPPDVAAHSGRRVWIEMDPVGTGATVGMDGDASQRVERVDLPLLLRLVDCAVGGAT